MYVIQLVLGLPDLSPVFVDVEDGAVTDVVCHVRELTADERGAVEIATAAVVDALRKVT
jgi:hypothetical protein